MSQHERKSHISDERLAELAAEKLRELEAERQALSEHLFQSMQEGTLSPDEQQKLERQIENHDGASDKLSMYRADMLDDD